MLFSLLFAYFLGAVPNGLWLCRLLYKKDIRKYNSHNIGATNVWRTFGKLPGIMVFLLDFLKGALAVYLASHLGGTPEAMVAAGIAAMLGHSFSIFLKFKGGKGVATGLGVIAVLMPLVTGIVFLVWFAIVYRTRYVSLGSVVSAALVPMLAYLFDAPQIYVILGAAAAALVIVRHRANIARLMHGSENKVNW